MNHLLHFLLLRLMIKNEYNSQSETSDIMNAVELSEYEKELTQHKLIKINLELYGHCS